jgi:lipoprotein-anchoring transpeptidase ErfK/SrfK
VPTYAASHGCVRVTIAAMNRLWSTLYIGERVHVYR